MTESLSHCLYTPIVAVNMIRSHLAALPEIQPDQIEQALLMAAEAGAFLSAEPELRSVLEELKASDANLKVREAARSALEAPTPENP